MKRLCIFATPGGQAEQARGRYVVFALQKLREVVDRLIVVTDIQPGHPNFAQIDGLADAILPSPGGAMRSSFEGYRSGFGAISPDELAAYDEIVFADSSCYGPV